MIWFIITSWFSWGILLADICLPLLSELGVIAPSLQFWELLWLLCLKCNLLFAERRSYRLYVHYLLDNLKSSVWKNLAEHHQLDLFCWPGLHSHLNFYPHPHLPVIQLPELLVNVLPSFLANIFCAFSFTHTWWQ